MTTEWTKDPDVWYVMGTGSRSMRALPQLRAQTIFDLLVEYIQTVLWSAHENKLHLISGMAEGWDEAIAKAAILLNLPWTAVIPTPSYGQYYWGKKSVTGRNRLKDFQDILGQASNIRYTIEEPDILYVKGIHANFLRNQMMAEMANEALAYLNPATTDNRGTDDAVLRCHHRKVPVRFYPFADQMELF